MLPGAAQRGVWHHFLNHAFFLIICFAFDLVALALLACALAQLLSQLLVLLLLPMRRLPGAAQRGVWQHFLNRHRKTLSIKPSRANPQQKKV